VAENIAHGQEVVTPAVGKPKTEVVREIEGAL
jgi:hypothetical protein